MTENTDPTFTERHSIMEEFQGSSYLSADSAGYIESLYEAYLKDPTSVDSYWQQYFSALPNALGNGSAEISHADIRHALREAAFQMHSSRTTKESAKMAESDAPGVQKKQAAVDALITAFRRFGHLNAKIDPLESPIKPDERLAFSHYGLVESDLKTKFATGSLFNGQSATLQQIITKLQQLYCGTIGIEYTRITNEAEREWLRDYFETRLPEIHFSDQQKKRILHKLSQSEGMEKYLDTRYPGQKRFSIEGGESLIPMLDLLANQATKDSVTEIVIGMAHRGRLNVLLNIMGQSPAELFQEFDGTKDFGMTTGDVKYHRGFSTDIQTEHGALHMALAFNPSHLEFINPVVLGSVRARQERAKDKARKRDYAVPILIHGDAAFAGQGVVMETLSMSQTRGYTVGGTLHIVLNNQVGFTTSNPADARSSHYCSDVAKMIDAPILHVNGDDPEAVLRVAMLSLAYRMRFHKDIVIDLVCYRVHGHNEADPADCTQPLMYQKIKAKKTPRALYAQALLAQGLITEADVKGLLDDYRAKLDAGEVVIDLVSEGLSGHYAANWTPYLNRLWTTQVDTGVSRAVLDELGVKITTLPEGFTLQRNVNMLITARKKMAAGEQLLDWGYAETMAYATLLHEGHPVRVTGEDVRRGTFFHRHAAIHDQKTGDDYMPLAHLSSDQPPLQVYDSLLSETGVLGFEYGYSTADPNALVAWEAQFGDFANVAQVIIDQFISSGWQKWNRLSGLTMLLPHGAEGMGPEHTSARLERYLQLCAQDNIQVCVPSTPAQIFHLLRRQVIRPYRKPLIVMTPKSLLRHKMAVSSLDELAMGQFRLLISEVDDINLQAVKRVVLCSGKVYYELLSKRREEKIEDIAIVRIEQLYPFPYEALTAELNKYPNLKEVVWCQEEPKNQGAWYCTRHRIVKCMPEQGYTLYYAGRDSMAAPAAGYPALHRKQQAKLVDQALGFEPAETSR